MNMILYTLYSDFARSFPWGQGSRPLPGGPFFLSRRQAASLAERKIYILLVLVFVFVFILVFVFIFVIVFS